MTYSIIHTEWSDGWGGQERRIVTELQGMQKLGHRVLLATRPTATIGLIAKDLGIPVLTMPFSGRFDKDSIKSLMRLVREDGYQIIHTHSSIDTWAGAIAAKLSGAWLVRTRHLNLPMHCRWYNVHGHYDRLVTCGETMRSLLIKNFGFRSENVVSIPTGIDFDLFKPKRTRDDVRAELALEPNQFVVLLAAVVRSVKRHDVALKAFSKILSTVPNARLVLAGDGPMLASRQQLAKELGIESSVLWLGHREDIPDLMMAVDAVLLTSRSEGVPQVLTQALGMGLPVVATNVGGIPELIQHEKTGLLAPSEDDAGLATLLMRVANNPDWATEMGIRGQKLVHENFSIETMLDKTEELYMHLIRK